jgi:hypothetical protein
VIVKARHEQNSPQLHQSLCLARLIVNTNAMQAFSDLTRVSRSPPSLRARGANDTESRGGGDCSKARCELGPNTSNSPSDGFNVRMVDGLVRRASASKSLGRHAVLCAGSNLRISVKDTTPNIASRLSVLCNAPAQFHSTLTIHSGT